MPEDGGVVMGMYNFNESIATSPGRRSATACKRGYPVYLSTKNTILKAYDGMFKDTFAEIFETEFKADVRRRRA